MKRGLVLFDPGEIRPDEFAARVSRLQRRLVADGIAAALVYGDVYRSGDISYLTNVCIYWNEGTVFVPASGEPALLSKLSSRVHPWMKSISTLKDTRAGNNIADLLVKTLADSRPGVCGLVEMEWWPAPLVDEIRAKLSGWEVRDLGPIIRIERQRPSAAELTLLRESAAVSARAVKSGSENALSNPQRAGRAELTARLAGVEDVYVFCDQCSSGADTLEVFSEYRGYWTTAARVLAKGSLAWARAFGRAYQAAESTLASGVSVGQLRDAVDRAMAGESLRWRVDLIDHTDLETRGDYRRPADAQAPVSAGAVAGLRLELTLEEGGRAVAADTFQITERGAERLTRDLPTVAVQ